MTRIGTGALRAIGVVAALTVSAAAFAQAADGGTQRRIVIVPATPEQAPAQPVQPQQRIVIVPATPEQAPAQPAQPAQPQQRIVIVPANPEQAPAQPAQPQRRIVIVPSAPQQAQPAQPQQRIVIVPNPQASGSAAAAPATPQPQQRIVIVPAPRSGAEAQAQGTTGAQPSPEVSNPAQAAQGSGTAQAAQSTGTGENAGNAQGTGSAEAAQGTGAAGAEQQAATDASGDQGSGEAFHTFTAMPDVAPRDQAASDQASAAAGADSDSATGSDAAAPGAGSATGTETASAATAPSEPLELMPDQQHARLGPFLSGPGSLTFILHHTLMGAAGGFATQGVAYDFSSDRGGKEAILAGTLVGAGIGFGTSAWWQFNHWVGKRSADFGIVNSVSGGMFLTGLLDLTTDDPTALAWSSFIGSELGGWLTAGIAGDDMSLDSALTIASGQTWGTIYGALLLGIVRFSGSSLRTETALDTLFITQGAGAILTAFALGHFHPSPRQLLRADISGAVVGAAVLILSGLVMGHFDSPTPYALSMASSATTMALVSIFWDPGAEPSVSPGGGGARPYRSLW